MGSAPTNTPNSRRAKHFLITRLYCKLVNHTSDILEWSQTHKSQLVCLCCVFFTLCQLTVFVYSFFYHTPQLHAFSSQVEEHAITYTLLSIIYYLCLFFVGFLITPSTNSVVQDFYCFICIFSYSIGSLIINYFLGFLSLVTGATIMTGPIIGLIFFKSNLVAYSSMGTILTGCILFSLINLNVIPYSFLPRSLDYMHKNDSVLLTLLGVGIPYIFVCFFITFTSVQKWKERENLASMLAQTDSLTGLFNRTVLVSEIQDYLSQPKIYRESVSVILLDLDDFKQINDTHGHLVGDTVLKNIAQSLKSLVRKNDLVARIGGEEFCIFLPKTGRDTAQSIAQRVVSKVSETITHQNEKDIRVSTSVGIVTVDSYQTNEKQIGVDALLNQADKAMYLAKKAGKNTYIASTII